jgi:hypothetical protein
MGIRKPSVKTERRGPCVVTYLREFEDNGLCFIVNDTNGQAPAYVCITRTSGTSSGQILDINPQRRRVIFDGVPSQSASDPQ